MMHFGLNRYALAGALACGVAFSGSVAAFEPTGDATADHFLKTVEAGGATISSVGSVSVDGSDISFTDLSVDIDDDGKKAKLEIGETTLTGASVSDNNRLSVQLLQMRTISIEADDGGLTVQNLETTDAVLPSPEEVSKAEAGGDAIAPLYQSAKLSGISIQTEDQGTVPIDEITVTVDAMDGELPTAGSFHLRGLKLSKTELDEDGQEMLTDLGYEEVDLSISGTGKWEPDDGLLDLQALSISGENVGNLTLSARINGFTREVMEKLDQAQGNPDQALGLLQGLGIEHLSIDLQNSSVVERVLDKQAQEAGTDRAAYVGQLTGALPFMLSVLNNPQFQEKVASALTTFLNDPKSLRAVAAPANPVPVTQLIGAAMAAPQTLPDILGVNIEANQDR